MAYEVATATVTIIPNMKGSQEKIEKDFLGSSDKAGASAGKKLGSSLVGAVKGAVTVAAIGKFLGDSLSAGADLQQSFGGLETLYGDAADAAKEYAYMAAEAGISANDYAEQAVSFGASLKQAFEGDTTKAVEAANTAIMDMTDNAAKMGTPLEQIQTAYQGFAKQNYTMLDNLKLGYGGTKEEMERLLADAQKLSGQKYDISNLGDVYEAIHVIQEDLGLTGVAAQEAATTFSGSFGAMRANAKNLLADLALGNNIGPDLFALGNTITTFVTGNLLPMVSNIVQQIPTILGQLPGFIAGLIPQIIPLAGQMISGLAQGIIDNIPIFAAGIGELITNAGSLLLNADWAGIASTIVSLIEGGWQALATAAQTIWNSVVTTFSQVIETVPILSDAWDAITTTASTLWSAVEQVFGGEISVVSIATAAWDAITDIAQNIWDAIIGIFTGDVSVKEVVTGAWDTLTNAAQTAWDAAKAVFEGVAPAVKSVTVTAWGALEGTAKKIWSKAKAVFTGAAPAVKSVTLTAWGTIADTAQNLFNAAKAKFETAAPAVKAVVTDAWNSITTTAGDIWTEVKNIFTSFEIEWPDFGALASGAFEGLKNAAKSAWDWVKNLFGGGAGDETVEAVHGSTAEMEAALAACNLVVSDVDVSAIDTANGIVEDAASSWESTVSGVSLVLPTVDALSIGTALSIVESAAAQMQAAMNFSWSLPALHGSVPSISVSMASASSSDGKTTVSYPVFNVGTKWFAEGGIFNQPSIIGVGEAGAEAALPLDAFWRRLDAEFDNAGTGATINNYIEVNGATDPVAYADELARELEQQLKRA